MKRIIPFLLATVIVLTVFSGCGKVEDDTSSGEVSVQGSENNYPYIVFGSHDIENDYTQNTAVPIKMEMAHQYEPLFIYDNFKDENFIFETDGNAVTDAKKLTLLDCDVTVNYYQTSIAELAGQRHRIYVARDKEDPSKQLYGVFFDDLSGEFVGFDIYTGGDGVLDYPEGYETKHEAITDDNAEEYARAFIAEYYDADLEIFVLTQNDDDDSSPNRERFTLNFTKTVNEVIVASAEIQFDNSGNVNRLILCREDTEATKKLPNLERKDMYDSIIPLIEAFHTDQENVESIRNYNILSAHSQYMSRTDEYVIVIWIEFDIHYKNGNIGKMSNCYYYIYRNGDSSQAE